MSKYRQTMAEAYAQVLVNENDYLKSKLNDTQIANIKQLWMRKTARDVTPSVKDMIKKMDIPTQLAIKHANINQLSKLVETLDESFSDAQIAVLKKQYEPMRGKTISIDNANKLGQLFTKFDSNKNALEKLYGGNIPFVSTMAMTRLMTKHGYKADQLNKLRKEERFPLDEEKELEILDEATLESVEITEGKIDSKKFDSLKKGDSMTITYQSTMSGTKSQKFVVKSKSRSAKYNTDKVTMYPDGNPNMARFFLYKRASGDVSMATGDMAATIKSVSEETLVEFTDQQIKMAYGIANDPRYKQGNYSGAVSAIEKIAKGLSSHPAVQNVLKRTNENLDEELVNEQYAVSFQLPKGNHRRNTFKTQSDANKYADAIKKKGGTVDSVKPASMSKNIDNIDQQIRMLNLGEGKMSQIDQMQKDGKSAAEIAKLMKLDVKTVKSILGEEVCTKCNGEGCEHCNDTGYHKEETLHEFKKMTVTFKSMADMAKASTDLAKHGFTINAKGMVMKVDGKGDDLNKYATDLKNFYKADIRAESYSIDESADEDFYNPVYEACWVGYKKVGMKKKGDKMVPNCVPESVQEAKEEEKPDVKKEKTDDSEKLKGDLQKKDAEIAALKQKSETEKTKAVAKDTKKMVNPETGEPLLQVGIAYKHLKDKMAKEKEKEEVSEMAKDKAYAIGMATAKKKYNDEPPLDKKTIKKGHEIGDKLSKMKNEDHPAKKVFEQIEGLKNKAEKSGMPYGILKKVYDRGMAAWRGGHRPGASQQQWAFARVNSFITKSSGTWGGADKDLAAKVKGK